MTEVHVVFCDIKLNNPGSGWPIVSELAFIAADRETARQYTRTHPNYTTQNNPWCWTIFTMIVGDDKSCADREVFDYRGVSKTTMQEAFDSWKIPL